MCINILGECHIEDPGVEELANNLQFIPNLLTLDISTNIFHSFSYYLNLFQVLTGLHAKE